KPERFQPTRFVFLIRSEAGQMQTEPAGVPVILPLSAQGASPASAPGPAISAPKPPPKPAPKLEETRTAPPPVQPAGGVTRVRTPRPQPAPPSAPPPHITPYKREPSDGTQPALAYPYATVARGRNRTEARS